MKGVQELAQEGAIQLFREVGMGMESVIVGVVGVLQLDVLERRLQSEYTVEVRRQGMPFTQIRWILNDKDSYDISKLKVPSSACRVEDMRGRRLVLFNSAWDVKYAEEHNPDIEFSEFGNVQF